MLDDLVAQNLARDPGRVTLLRRPFRAVIEVPDAGVRASVIIGDGRVVVADGDDPGATLRIRADAMRVLALASVPLVAGLPDVRTREGRGVVGDLLAGRLRVGGLLGHLGDVRRLTALLSVR